MQLDVSDPASVKEFLKTCSHQPGIYQMMSKTDEVLYVGKAKNLSKRLSSYFNKSQNSLKISSLMQQVAAINTTITNSETEALLLGCNLIKQYKPKYNILLRDDKSYPYICLSKHKFPRIFLYRGKQLKDAICYGPFPNGYAARQTIRLLQQVFLIRVCTDKYYNNRTRPCLLYQINRCSAPCVAHIDEQKYQESINNTKLFLDGKSSELIRNIAEQMEGASLNLDFELAAHLRDQIRKLQQVAEQQFVESNNDTRQINNPIDVIGIQTQADLISIAILKFRDGKLIGSNQYLNKIPFGDIDLNTQQDNTDEVLLSVLSQYYLTYADIMPDHIISNYAFLDNSKQLLSDIIKNPHLKITSRPKGFKSNWLELAIKNADDLLFKKLSSNQIYFTKFQELKTQLNLPGIPKSIECFDVSHTFGKQTIASCVVYNQSGQDKSNYRRYNITETIKGDDLAALKEVLFRRYKKIAENPETLPELVLIDGGKSQVKAAIQILEELNLTNISVFGICKGEGRRAVNDRIISGVDLQDVPFARNSEGLHLLQEIRDEAHRFAIMGHRAKRNKQDLHSVLEDLPGIGPKRRKNLLTYLGGMQQLKAATKQQLASVPGISKEMAEKIYDYLHQ